MTPPTKVNPLKSLNVRKYSVLWFLKNFSLKAVAAVISTGLFIVFVWWMWQPNQKELLILENNRLNKQNDSLTIELRALKSINEFLGKRYK